MYELQRRVRAWCEKWVPNCPPSVAWQKVEEEMFEVEHANSETLPGELADCIIAYFSYAESIGLDLAAEIDAKMTRNETVNWIRQPNGTVRWDRSQVQETAE